MMPTPKSIRMLPMIRIPRKRRSPIIRFKPNKVLTICGLRANYGRCYRTINSIYWDQLNLQFYPKIKIGSQKNRLEVGLREIESKCVFNLGGESDIHI